MTARASRLYLEALRAADGPGAYQVAAQALESGLTAPALYQRVIAPAMHEIGELWEKGALTVADEHLATALTHRVLAALRPPIRLRVGGPDGGRGRPQALLATVQGEQHALGLRMAADVLEEVGYGTIYLGADVPTEALLQAVAAFEPDLLALAATMPEAKPTLEEVAATVRDAYPRIDLLLGGQAAGPPGAGGKLIRDLEALSAVSA
jgi:methanogenic corrinoid protein MtbC1